MTPRVAPGGQSEPLCKNDSLVTAAAKLSGRTSKLNLTHPTPSMLQELSLYQRLSHPNVVQYIGHHYDDDKSLYIFLEYVAGGFIAGVLSSFGPLSEGVVRSYTRQIVQGLAYVHSQGSVSG